MTYSIGVLFPCTFCGCNLTYDFYYYLVEGGSMPSYVACKKCGDIALISKSWWYVSRVSQGLTEVVVSSGAFV